MTTTQLNRISRGFHAVNIGGNLILVTGSKGAWCVSVNGETITETAASLVDAEMAAELHIMERAA